MTGKDLIESLKNRVVAGAELYEEALSEECTCYTDPDQGCPRCRIVEKARTCISTAVGVYRQQ